MLGLKHKRRRNGLNDLRKTITLNNNKSNGSSPTKPKLLEVEFSDDLDMPSINEKVMEWFAYQKHNLINDKKQLSTINSDMTTTTTMVEYNFLKKKSESLQKHIEDIESGSSIEKYKQEYSRLYSVYNDNRKIRKVIDVCEDLGEEHEMIDSKGIARVKTIVSFLELASNYIDIVWSCNLRVANDDNFCIGCGEDVSHIAVSQDGDLICDMCGTVDHISLVKQMASNSIQLPNTKEYRDEGNFKKIFKKFTCQQEISYDMNKLCENLDEYFISIGYKPASYYRSLKTDGGWKKKGTSVELLSSGLKAISRNKLYEDHNIIGHHLWGWTIPDVSHLEGLIMEDYDKTQKVYDTLTVEERNRSSCISRPFRLFKHLQLRGVECEPSDFKIPIQSETMRNQERLWEKMCTLSDDPTIYYIPFSDA